jgi:diguanylate cyclase (GGDEF)-like protein
MDSFKLFTDNLRNSDNLFKSTAETISKFCDSRFIIITKIDSNQNVKIMTFRDKKNKHNTHMNRHLLPLIRHTIKGETFTSHSKVQLGLHSLFSNIKLDITNISHIGYKNYDNEIQGHIVLLNVLENSNNFLLQRNILDVASLALTTRLELMATQERLKIAEHNAKTDALTGISNREALHQHLTSVQQIYENDGTEFLALVADLDGLKVLNDQQGHDKGDEFLCLFAQESQKICRSSDLTYRVGGDEFTIIFEGATEKIKRKVEDRLIEAIKRIRSKLNFSIDVSLGFAMLTESEGNIKNWLKLADQRMYLMKNKKNRSRVVNLH